MDKYAGVPLSPKAVEELRQGPAVGQPAISPAAQASAPRAQASAREAGTYEEYQQLRLAAKCEDPTSMSYLYWNLYCKQRRTPHPFLGQ